MSFYNFLLLTLLFVSAHALAAPRPRGCPEEYAKRAREVEGIYSFDQNKITIKNNECLTLTGDPSGPNGVLYKFTLSLHAVSKNPVSEFKGVYQYSCFNTPVGPVCGISDPDINLTMEKSNKTHVLLRAPGFSEDGIQAVVIQEFNEYTRRR